MRLLIVFEIRQLFREPFNSLHQCIAFIRKAKNAACACAFWFPLNEGLGCRLAGERGVDGELTSEKQMRVIQDSGEPCHD